MNPQPKEKIRMTAEEYFEIERSSDIKHEYFDGEIFAMGGAKPNHNLIGFNIAGELTPQLKNTPCRGFIGDQRVKIEAGGDFVYPDISIACENIELDDDSLPSLLNPIVIIEILSKSTEAYDRGKKFAHYRTIPTLQEYILVSQYYCLVEKFSRNDDGSWNLTAYDKMEQSIRIDSIGCELLLSDIYYRIEFEDSAHGAKRVEIV